MRWSTTRVTSRRRYGSYGDSPARASRKAGPDRRTGQRASKRWERANRARGRTHHRVTNLRRDGIHKLTNRLTREYGTVVVEDLNVAGMVRNRSLARAVSDAGFGEIRRQFTYKTTWNGGRLVTADRWYPSSKTCSGCGAVKAKLPLRVRIYACETCGMALDRDENAARNLAELVVAGSGPETLNGRGADCETPLAGLLAVKRQPRAAHAGQTRTVDRQR
ncbi:RNA-guided endonuclease TnpB family protein [Solwaraspora sp. WMMD406]|uniref:RNA-guided endonuclease TnpB family protein n=1 Tax=Solwaraspora sp. WMMD406 TaxID=3016095 RepID=UPI002415BF75|nr:RNA-guided endonuclease TnpB family protein [Solwaraspora sp. WMMD406]MDG4766268.1 RNA-guided endonuclease TnpB family protein [Solwaraspora sp. WMMD406]